MNWFAYWILYLFPAVTLGGTLLSLQHGGAYWYFLTPVLAGGVIPLLDIWIGGDKVNPTAAEEQGLTRQIRYRLPLYTYVPVQIGIVGWSCYLVSHHSLSAWDWFGLLLSVGVVNSGIAINIAHELCHRSQRLEQTLAKILWLTVSYMHFHIEHRQGHHLRVATPEDPATARLGESVYAFYPRSIIGSYRSALQTEISRLQQQGYGFWSPHNQMIWFALLPLLVGLSLTPLWGWLASLFFFLQSAVAILTLETVNYLEHYGLERKQLQPGKYEKVGIQHSWNSNMKLTNYILLKLQRHADHHAYPGRRYQILRDFPESPQLPLGYGSMILLTLVPPLWKKVMDPRALATRSLRSEDGADRPGSTEERVLNEV